MLFASVAGKVKGTILFVLQDADRRAISITISLRLWDRKMCSFPFLLSALWNMVSATLPMDSPHRGVCQNGSGKSVYVVHIARAQVNWWSHVRILMSELWLWRQGRPSMSRLWYTRMKDFGFVEQDYVYEPGQFALAWQHPRHLFLYQRISVPHRLLWRWHRHHPHLSSAGSSCPRTRREEVEIVPELAKITTEKVPFFHFLPQDAILVMKDFVYVHDTIEQIYNDGFSSQAMTERMEAPPRWSNSRLCAICNRNGNCSPVAVHRRCRSLPPCANLVTNPRAPKQATITFDITAQPLFHKNFDLPCASRSTIISCADTVSISLPIVPSKQAAKSQGLFERGSSQSYPLPEAQSAASPRIPSSPRRQNHSRGLCR